MKTKSKFPILRVDSARRDNGQTGVYIRALNTEQHWTSVDINHLDKKSLKALLEAKDPKWSHNLIGCLLGYGQLHEEEKESPNGK